MRPTTPSRRTELWYRGQLLACVQRFNAPLLALFTHATIGDDARGGRSDSTISLAFRRAIDLELERLATDIYDRMIEPLTIGFVQRANQQNHQQTVAAVNRAMGIDVSAFVMRSPAIQAAIDAAMLENAGLIRSIGAQYLDKVRLATGRAHASGQRISVLKEEIRHIGSVTETRARLIARDQTNKLNGALTKARQTSLGVKRYRWSTSGDERVRQDHQALDGQVFSWDKPPAVGHPGQDIQCRCVAIPIFDIEDL